MCLWKRWGLALVLVTVWLAGHEAAGQAIEESWSRQQVRLALLDGGEAIAGKQPGTLAAGTRSPVLALALSAAVPGLGQAYNRNWVMAGVHAAVEAALWTGIVTWRARGDDGVDAYQAFAHADWSPLRYAQWLNDYRAYQNITAEEAVDVGAYLGIDFQHPNSWTEAEATSVRRLFNEIRRLERVMTHDVTGASFSHLLPYFGEQQYYELIGKYYQFGPGWCDYGDTACGSANTPWFDGEGAANRYISPNEENVSDRFEEYADDHQAANDLLRRASRTTAVVLLNHLVAGVEAAISSRLHNIRVQSQMTADVGGSFAWQTAVTVRL